MRYGEYQRGDKVLYKNKLHLVNKYSLPHSEQLTISEPESIDCIWVFKKYIIKLTRVKYPEYYL